MAKGDKHTSEHISLASIADSAILLAVEDGKGMGHYVTVSAPDFSGLPAEYRSAAMVGFKYEAVRDFQGKAKSLAKEGKDIDSGLAEFALSYKPKERESSIDTAGSKRLEFAKARLADAIKRAGQSANDATISAKALPWMEAKQERRDAVESDFRDFLAQGYKPSKRNAGGATGSAVADLGNLADLD